MSIAILGTGLLGSGFVLHQLELGNPVVVWNRSPDKTAPLAAAAATVAATPADAVRQAERVHLVLAEDPAVDAVLGDALAALPDGVPVLDHSTNLPDKTAARYARLRAQGVRYLHAPVFMAPANSRAGTGLMLIAGPTDEVDALLPALGAMTGRVWHVGERPDLAAVHKLHGNACLLGFAGLMGDLLAMGEAQGLAAEDTMSLFEHFQPGSSFPWIGKRVLGSASADTSFALTMARKDVRLMIQSAAGKPLSVLPGVAASMDRAIEGGHGDQDFAIFALPR